SIELSLAACSGRCRKLFGPSDQYNGPQFPEARNDSSVRHGLIIKAAASPTTNKDPTSWCSGVLMLMMRALALASVCIICIALSVASAIAAECQQVSFGNWLENFKQEATGLGIAQPTIASALNAITYDPAIIARDHSQNVFQQSFEQFSGRMVSPDRLRKGANMLKRYGSILGRMQDRYGAPGEVLVAIWGLESDYGVNQGKYSTLRSLATLAYDCRRSEKFRAELLDALRITERGDLTSSQMIGA